MAVEMNTAPPAEVAWIALRTTLLRASARAAASPTTPPGPTWTKKLHARCFSDVLDETEDRSNDLLGRHERERRREALDSPSKTRSWASRTSMRFRASCERTILWRETSLSSGSTRLLIALTTDKQFLNAWARRRRARGVTGTLWTWGAPRWRFQHGAPHCRARTRTLIGWSPPFCAHDPPTHYVSGRFIEARTPALSAG